jgi:hypothetical protein
VGFKIQTMTQITNNEEKQVIADKIKRLVEQINEQVELANKMFISVHFVQNPKMGHENAHLCAFVSETVSY